MTNSRGRTPVLVAAALVTGLLLGTTTAATAAGLTKGAVRKIATKVVKKQSGSLSVAHAATADRATDATLLGGSTSDQLKTTAYVYTLPVQDPAFTRTYSFPGLPPGNYLAAYSVYATVSGTSDRPQCSLRETPTSTTVKGIAYGAQASNSTTANTVGASTYLTSASGPVLNCNIGGSGTALVLSSTFLSTVTFLPVDIPITGTIAGP